MYVRMYVRTCSCCVPHHCVCWPAYFILGTISVQCYLLYNTPVSMYFLRPHLLFQSSPSPFHHSGPREAALLMAKQRI